MRTTALTLLTVLLAACSGTADDAEMADASTTPAAESAPAGDAQVAPNTLTAEEREAGFRLLFDGESTDGWHVFKEEGTRGWEARDGMLVRSGPGGDIVTDDTFSDFELRLEWRVTPGGNSGILYRVVDSTEYTYHGAPEMQVLDDEAHADGGSRLTAAGANYGLHPAPEGVVRPAGEWNDVRLVVDGAHVEHWLNGEKIVEYELWSDEWNALVTDSKFVEWPEYGMAREGRIGLQDHGDEVHFRSIRVRRIDENTEADTESDGGSGGGEEGGRP